MLKKLHSLLIVLLLCCTTIASLPEEPKPPLIQTLNSLAKYKTQLSEYVMSLVTFLTKTKVKVNGPNYPEYPYPDLSTLKDEHSITAVKHNINIYLEYIKKTKLIAEKVYNQYSQLKM
ncbi:BBA14 family lipoprotein [Borreliella bissettiae]|uniref:Borrelia orf-D family protein n=1 Tax=Borrelia bissettiae (strain DSM 17990 / CIP 109136 / DN127) TaxID=521010 RepID=G0ANS5_BORBD|nr:BBA14 family lipoprotein [Borreliella bissettiae]AEL19351.1 borrelia orf-D family protein [Borreliella bissettiae DN127]